MFGFLHSSCCAIGFLVKCVFSFRRIFFLFCCFSVKSYINEIFIILFFYSITELILNFPILFSSFLFRTILNSAFYIFSFQLCFLSSVSKFYLLTFIYYFKFLTAVPAIFILPPNGNFLTS